MSLARWRFDLRARRCFTSTSVNIVRTAEHHGQSFRCRSNNLRSARYYQSRHESRFLTHTSIRLNSVEGAGAPGLNVPSDRRKRAKYAHERLNELSDSDRTAEGQGTSERILPAGLLKARRYWTNGLVDIEKEETGYVYELLRLSASQGKTREVDALVDELVRKRSEAPSLRLYGSLILVNVNEAHGSISRVNALLEEMQGEGLNLDAGICHDVLKVLSIHPDYVLSADILDYMRQRWLSLTSDGRIDLATASFRHDRLEEGCDLLIELMRDGIAVPSWLSDLAIYTLLEEEEMDHALRLAKRADESGLSSVTKTTWLQVLDIASSKRHIDAARHVWNMQVFPGYLNVSNGTCYEVLSTAACAGDTELSTDVFRYLGLRSTRFKAEHYEALMTSYLNAKTADLEAALAVLTVMAGAGLLVTNLTTRALYEYLAFDQDMAKEALSMLHDFKERGRLVPVAALNAILKAFIDNDDFDNAITLYKSMHMFEEIGRSGNPRKPFPDAETFNLLFQGARIAQPVAFDTAMFLASEQEAVGIKRDSLTYDRLILLCLKAGETENAQFFAEEMRKAGFEPRRGTAVSLRHHLNRGDREAEKEGTEDELHLPV